MKISWALRVASMLVSLVTVTNAWGVAPAANPIGTFFKVAPGIYRGQRPEAAGIKYLASIGVKTVLDLENDMDEVAAEYAVAKSAGIHFISKPMSGFWAPRTATVDAALSVLENPANYPVFIHCQHGQDRTGLIVGLFRVEAEKEKPAEAYAEMLKIGFHPALFFLNHYFEERTGFED